MSTKLKVGALVVVLAGVVVPLLLQQQQIRRLLAENAELHSQLGQVASLQDTNGHLAEQLKAAVETSQASQNELMRLRGQAVRLRQLEQENTQLKAQRQQLDRQVREAQLAEAARALVTPAPDVKVTSTIPNVTTTDLGILELSDGTAARFDLGGGTNCVVTPTALPDGNATMQITLGLANADGTMLQLGTSRITARPGQHCSISVGDRMIALTVQLKKQ
jgi:hypothetical protein